MFGVVGAIGITVFVRGGGLADDRVLVEGDKVGIQEDVEECVW